MTTGTEPVTQEVHQVKKSPEEITENQRKQTIIQEVQTVIADGSVTPQQISEMTQDEVKQIGIEVTGAEDLELVKQTADELGQGYDFVVRIDQSQMEQLTAPQEIVNVDTDEASAAVEDLTSKIENIPDGEAHVDADTAGAMGELQSVEDKLNTLSTITATPSVSVNVTGQSTLDSVKSIIDSLTDKTVTITVNHVNNGSSSGGTSPAAGLNNEGIAFAGGTGRIPMKHNGETLVGEEGYEIHTDRDRRRWQIVGANGPEFRNDISPDDIIFSHAQSEQLLKHGHTSTHGRALVGGNAYEDPLTNTIQNSTATGNLNNQLVQLSKTASGYQSAQEKATQAVKTGTGATQANTQATAAATTGLDAFKKRWKV